MGTARLHIAMEDCIFKKKACNKLEPCLTVSKANIIRNIKA